MGREFELKFLTDNDTIAAIQKKYGEFTPISMETTYYDTPNGDLSARRITLRRRLENGLSVCTVKTPGDGHSRGEWDAEADTIRDAIPLLRAAGCTVDLETLTKAGISPICGARFIRLAKPLEAESCRVELALDQGCLMGGGKEIPLCEVEVELKSGDEAGAVAFARQLARDYGLQPEENSKFRRALVLAKGENHG